MATVDGVALAPASSCGKTMPPPSEVWTRAERNKFGAETPPDRAPTPVLSTRAAQTN
jgi:hypothetical protein